VLLDAGEAVEALGDDVRAEVVAAACQVFDLDLGPGQRLLDPFLQLFSVRHRRPIKDSESAHPSRSGRRRLRLQSTQMVNLTDVAAEKVSQFLSGQNAGETAGLRVGVRGGGCSGFQYALALDEQREGDHVFEDRGIRVIVDEASLQYVSGSTVDYKESLMGAGFEVNNPNVVAACGCGSSFRVADEEPSCGAPA
jgi:iron-sulfur cluster assembly protein